MKQLTFKDEIYDIMWDKSGSVFFVADMKGRISLFDGTLSSTKSQPAVQLSGVHISGRSCECLCMHPDNTQFVSGGSDSLIGFWDFEDLLCTGTLSSNECQVRCLDFSPCGSFLSALSYDETKKKSSLQLYDTANRKPIMRSTEFDFLKKKLKWNPARYHDKSS